MLGAYDSKKRIAANAKYEDALPVWARSGGGGQYVLLALLALCEEFVFRAVALGSLLYEWELSKEIAAALVAIAFGFSHWYYGVRQVALKLIIGLVLVWAALLGGWVSAVLAHVALNIALVAISTWRKRTRGAHEAHNG
nr:CPBP family intramembrane glutamic endopeptidase [Canibacter zhuwentaonis]